LHLLWQFDQTVFEGVIAVDFKVHKKELGGKWGFVVEMTFN